MTLSEQRIPISPDGMSSRWLESALGVGVASAEVEPIGEGSGFAGSVYRVRIQYADSDVSLPDTMIWKTVSKDERTHRFLATLGAYEREYRFYDQLANRVEIAPSAYFSRFDRDSSELCLLTEDVSYMTPGDQIAGCTPEQALTVVAETARLHSQFWRMEPDAQLDWAPTFDGGSGYFQRAHSIAWKRLSRDSGISLDGLVETALKMAPRVPEVKERLSRPPLTLTHGDLRLDNIFFGREPDSESVKLIDWQAIRMGRGMYDIAYFLSTSIPAELRIQIQERAIREYVHTLSDMGVSGYSYSECVEDFGWALLDVVTFIGVIGSTLDFQSDRGLELSETIMARLWSAVQDSSAIDLLE